MKYKTLVTLITLAVLAALPAAAQQRRGADFEGQRLARLDLDGQGFALVDNFTWDSSLNSSLWTTSSPFLTALASASSSPPATFVAPALSFSPSGMQMTGPSADYQTTGVQSLATFSAPFTVVTYVEPTAGTANPVEIFLGNSELTQFLTTTINFNPIYEGVWATAPNMSQLWQLGDRLQPTITPTLDALYKITISVDKEGAATVSVENAGTLLGSLSGLQPGLGPFHLVLGQRIGLATPGPQSAVWKYVQVARPHSVCLD